MVAAGALLKREKEVDDMTMDLYAMGLAKALGRLGKQLGRSTRCHGGYRETMAGRTSGLDSGTIMDISIGPRYWAWPGKRWACAFLVFSIYFHI